MGATDADIRAAQIRARQQAEQDQVLLGNQGACNKLLSLAPVEISREIARRVLNGLAGDDPSSSASSRCRPV